MQAEDLSLDLDDDQRSKPKGRELTKQESRQL